MCFSEVLSLWCLLKREKNPDLTKRQSQIGVIRYDSEADPILVSEFPPSRRPVLTSNMAVRRFHAGFTKRISAPFRQGLLSLERALIDTYILQQQMKFPFRGFLNKVGVLVVDEVKFRWKMLFLSPPVAVFTSDL